MSASWRHFFVVVFFSFLSWALQKSFFYFKEVSIQECREQKKITHILTIKVGWGHKYHLVSPTRISRRGRKWTCTWLQYGDHISFPSISLYLYLKTKNHRMFHRQCMNVILFFSLLFFTKREKLRQREVKMFSDPFLMSCLRVRTKPDPGSWFLFYNKVL